MSPGQPARGERGEPGQRGEPGARGLTRAQGWAIIFLFSVAVLLGGGALFWTSHETDVAQAAQQRQSAETERKLCRTLGMAAALRPPAGDPAANPSRAFEQGEHRVWVQAIADIGCDR